MSPRNHHALPLAGSPSPLLRPKPAEPAEAAAPAAVWSLQALAGRLTELSTWSGGALLTLAFDLVLQAQHEGEPAAWITLQGRSFFPPDAAASGVDLSALPVLRVTDGRAAGRAADKLLRSGAFGLVVVDLAGAAASGRPRNRTDLPVPLQSRLLGLARKHDAAMVFLTEKREQAPSLGSLISLRAQAHRTRTGEGRFCCEARVIKDKRQGPGRSHRQMHHGPAGLR